ncbi:hypothetical protein PQE66_gp037 [Bacillus phage PBC2]|uniref:Uncharacterized protein n=1 Tax=Bacillus phage PBC2 TaxID=1675029 RepID=A0A218KBT3_9CAUD|nr:hypothetical protein PQE66_gp037 [Bacillus phage PBC2]AKQ08352.1 hypothetical protein PBC2_037 [Bacillus phage PBC2]
MGNKNFKIIVENADSRNKPMLTLFFETLLEMRIAYELLTDSIYDSSAYVRMMARDDSGIWNGYEID